MTNLPVILVIFALLVPLWLWLRKDFLKGLCYGVFLCVSLTTFLRIETGGTLPELTIHRLILISVFIFWFRRPELRSRFRGAPFIGVFIFWAATNFISLLITSIDFTDSLKRYLDFVIEVGAFYVVVATSIRTRDEAVRVLRAAVLGLTVVAFLAIIEHYTRFNPVDRFIPGYQRDEGAGRDIQSTYPIRILLGVGMAMGWPLCFALLQVQPTGFPGRKFLWLSVGLMLAACFFAQSRGPWLACVVGGAVLGALGSMRLRKILVLIPLLAVVTLMFKPGVLESLSSSAKNTLDTDSFKGGTFLYRFELWKVAWHHVSKEPHRLLFGYGPGSGRHMGIEWNLSYRGRVLLIDSWDNQYAYDLFRSGLVGSIAALTLFLGMWRRLFQMTRRLTGPDRDLMVGLLASLTSMLFAMTNVLIFAKQLDYLFWSLAACGFAIGGHYLEKKPRPVPAVAPQPALGGLVPDQPGGS